MSQKQGIEDAQISIGVANYNLRKAISDPANRDGYIKHAIEALKSAANAIKPAPAQKAEPEAKPAKKAASKKAKQ